MVSDELKPLSLGAKVESCFNRVIDNDADYWELTTGHHDWGRDSIDSIENFDICSEACLREKFDEYVRESSSSWYNTMYFNVERTW